MRDANANLAHRVAAAAALWTPHGAIARRLHLASEGAPGARGWRRVLVGVRRALRGAAGLVRERRTRRMALRELRTLDERVLKDIGISRGAIPALARGTWFDEPKERAERAATGRSVHWRRRRLGAAAAATRPPAGYA